jgi:hypothetical protein
MKPFPAKIRIIGINPYILLPPTVLKSIFTVAGRDRGPLPVKGTINGKPYLQTLVKFSGAWRLYVNGPMLKATGLAVGDSARFTILYDPKPRLSPMPTLLKRALATDTKAKATFDALSASRQKEIKRYLNNLKAPATLDRNVTTVLRHLGGKKALGLHALLRVRKP